MNFLISGLTLAGLLCGYLIGASNTPVVGAALPILGSVIMAGFAVNRNRSFNDVLAKVKDLHESSQRVALEQYHASFPISAKSVGVALIVFFVALFVGVFSGSHVRTYELFVPKPRIFDPVWVDMDEYHPRTIDEALEVMKLYHVLVEGGMTRDGAIGILELHEQEPTMVINVEEMIKREVKSALDDSISTRSLSSTLDTLIPPLVIPSHGSAPPQIPQEKSKPSKSASEFHRNYGGGKAGINSL